MTAVPPVLLALALLYACWRDLRERVIPNGLNLAIAAAAPLAWWADGLSPWPGMALQLALAALVLALFAALFARGWMGGGDVKLAAALALWLPAAALLPALLWTAMLGGLVTLGTLVWARLRPAPGAIEVPYGLAIAGAGFLWLGERYLYQIG